MTTRTVRHTQELERILNLPRRVWTEEAAADLAREMTECLKTPDGTMALRPVQAIALHDIAIHRGGLLPIGVGEGKTLISLLAPYVLGSIKPVLLLPANLIKKTIRDLKKYSKHFLIPQNIRLISYEWMGRVQAAAELAAYAPDLLGCDEVQKLKNKRAAVTRRVARFMHEHPETPFVAMSGTMMKRSIENFAHIARWALKGNAPIPKTDAEIEEWAQALDQGITDEARFEAGALLKFCNEEELANDQLTAARRGFQRRLLETPGVVASPGDGEKIGASIYVSAITYEMADYMEGHFKKLRNAWLTPDDWKLYSPTLVWQHARELAAGLFYKWDPRPPEPWMTARKNWHGLVRDVLSLSRSLDSPEHLAQATDAGVMPSGRPIPPERLKEWRSTLKAWRDIRDTFRPNAVPVWCDQTTINICVEWMKKNPKGIVWTQHRFFAEKLSELSGVKYYGADGEAPDGELIDDAPPGPVIASLKANKEGRNLQYKWNCMLFVTPPDGGDDLQQAIARVHRPGQPEDEVRIDVMLGCAEHVNAWRKCIADAYAVRDTTGAPQKILIADFDDAWPSDAEMDSWKGARWEKTPEVDPMSEIFDAA